MSKRADPFEWSGGHPALDFVNTLDERPFDRPIENLATYRDLVRFAQLAGLVEPALARTLRTRAGLASSRVAGRARKLRKHFFNVLAAVHKHKPLSQSQIDDTQPTVSETHEANCLKAPY
jgi:hypothetical protein